MENLIIIPGLLMAACVVSCFVLMFKIKNESLNAPALVKFFRLEMLSSRYLTSRGRYYRILYWRLFFLGFVFAGLTVIFMYFLIPEFQQEFVGISKTV